MRADCLTHHHGGGALALYVQPAADRVLCIFGPPGLDVLGEGSGVDVADAQTPPTRLVAQPEQVPDDVIDMQLYAVRRECVVARNVLGASVAQVQLWQQRGVERFEGRLPALELTAEATAGTLPAAQLLPRGLAVRVQDLNGGHAITPAGPRRRGWPTPSCDSRWAM